jgi:hypothetical protein
MVIHLPLSKELEDVVLTLLGEPCLTRYEDVHLLKVDFEDLRGKGGDKVLCESAIILLQCSWKLRRITIST